MSTPIVTVIDYGMGNLLSVSRGVEKCGAQAILSSDPAEIARAEMLILPGVGAFADGMAELEKRKILAPIKEAVHMKTPLLGICLGMQMLMESSEEFGVHAGLGLLSGTVTAIPAHGVDGTPHNIPHMGWAPIRPPLAAQKFTNPLLDGVASESALYFIHSYQAQPATNEELVAIADYNGIQVTAMVSKNNIYGCQFHPEKSGPVGLKILHNFLSLSR